MSDQNGLIKVCVCGYNAGGEPDIYFCKVNVGDIRDEDNPYHDGAHYDIAELEAWNDGYEKPMVSFDEHDYLFRHMNCEEKFAWDTADVIGLN